MELDIFDSRFNISSYVKNIDKIKDTKSDDGYPIKDALSWSEDSFKAIITPTKDLEELELRWIKYNEMPKIHRRESDWKSIELFGMTNQEHYEYIKEKIRNRTREKSPLEQDHPIIENEIPIDNINTYYDSYVLNYTVDDVNNAIEWSRENNRIIIHPTRTLNELEDLWESFNTMILKHRRESDWKSNELFGVTNLRHYEYLKLQFLSEDLKKGDKLRFGSVLESIEEPYYLKMKKYLINECGRSSNLEITKSLLEMMSKKLSIQEELLSDTIVSDILDKSECIDDYPTTFIPYGDMPMIEPEDMLSMGVYNTNPEDNFFDALSDNSNISESVETSKWFENYYGYRQGIYTEFTSMTPDWIQKLRELTYGLSKLTDENKIKARKQSILELGWNPNIPFNERTMQIANKIARAKTKDKIDTTNFIDLSEFVDYQNNDISLNEDISTNPLLKPVFIVLTQGQALHSKLIMAYTKSKYSHASISLDPSLENMYSFSMDGSEHGWRGGFVKENVKDKDEKTNIGVFAFFVTNNIYEKIKNMIENFMNNVSNTFYSYRNLATLVFNIPYNKDDRLICSQFVDKCLKFAGINITKKDSSLVNPGDLERSSRHSRKIYTIYQGLARRYNKSKIANLLNSISLRAKPIKEVSSIYYQNEASYIRGIINNIYDVSSLMEMENHFDIVQNKNLRSIIEKNIFDKLKFEEYCESYSFDNQSSKLSIDSINIMISELTEIY